MVLPFSIFAGALLLIFLLMIAAICCRQRRKYDGSYIARPVAAGKRKHAKL